MGDCASAGMTERPNLRARVRARVREQIKKCERVHSAWRKANVVRVFITLLGVFVHTIFQHTDTIRLSCAGVQLTAFEYRPVRMRAMPCTNRQSNHVRAGKRTIPRGIGQSQWATAVSRQAPRNVHVYLYYWSF